MWEFEQFKEKQPEAILEQRMVNRNNHVVSQVLVKWKGADTLETSWDDFAVVAGKLPATNFELET